MRNSILPSTLPLGTLLPAALADGGSGWRRKRANVRRPTHQEDLSYSSGGPPYGQLCTEVPPITLERPAVPNSTLPFDTLVRASGSRSSSAHNIDYFLLFRRSRGSICLLAALTLQQVKSYLRARNGRKQSGGFCVTTIESHDAISAGDALRVIYSHGVHCKVRSSSNDAEFICLHSGC
ncbi:hypothetical protein HPP92_016871 [Vanilla planifolia]|uniref:Uncharacterized protein n=1 Tax=Vanilla planifolia TaxID=51239 RepID=A0A835USJ7_VANPL|nr:hypothetical protein HPP92_016871 [Vanilla planifolia]